MISPFQISEIIDSPSKLAILRVMASRKGFKATGREIARLSGYSAPSAHESLKDLHACNILNLEIIGRQHIYTLNEEDRVVKRIIRPMFEAEGGIKEEIRDFLVEGMKKAGIKQKVFSLILYGSFQKGKAGPKSDVDIAVVVAKTADVKRVEDVFTEMVLKFRGYFAVHLDAYIKSAAEFRSRRKRDLPPVSTLMKSYSVLYGKDPLEV